MKNHSESFSELASHDGYEKMQFWNIRFK